MNCIILNILDDMVVDIRKELANRYDITNGEYKDYRGLCDLSVNILQDKLKNYSARNNIDIWCNVIHGEQRHTPKIESCNWYMEHTWAKVSFGNMVIYVDPTSSQFKYLYKDIPDYYISLIKPKWYYPDIKNPAYSGITKYMNDYIKISGLECIYYLQYKVWGKISDTIHQKLKH